MSRKGLKPKFEPRDVSISRKLYVYYRIRIEENIHAYIYMNIQYSVFSHSQRMTERVATLYLLSIKVQGQNKRKTNII